MTREYSRGDRHVYRCIAGEHLLVALHGDSAEPVFALTPTAATLWTHLADWATAAELADVLATRYDVSRGQALLDVQDFLGQLDAVGAVSARETTAA